MRFIFTRNNIFIKLYVLEYKRWFYRNFEVFEINKKRLERILAFLVSLVIVISLNYIDDNLFFERVIELEENQAQITRIIDGDTIEVRTKDKEKEKVRLLLIDTPELSHFGKPEQPYALEAKQYAERILKIDSVVTLEIGNPDRDKYDRLLAYIWIDGQNFNQMIVKEGLARVGYIFEPNTKYLNDLKRNEAYAKENKLNIYSIENYVTDKGFNMKVII